MGRYKCCADNCESSSESDIKFFKFPLYNPKKLRRWLGSMGREDWVPSRFSVLCIHHFEEQHIDRTGKCITLREEAVPTIFSPTTEVRGGQEQRQGQRREEEQRFENKVSHEPSVTGARSKKGKPRGRPPKSRAAEALAPVAMETESNAQQSEEAEEGAVHRDPEVPEQWSVILDEELLKIHSFPHFFHGNYCVSQDIQWAPDKSSSEEVENSTNVIEVTAPWQWLCLDIRGPLPLSSSGHRFLLSLSDYFSKWLEAWPLDSLLPEHAMHPLLDVIRHFGFPVRILSRLPKDMVDQINEQLKLELSVGFPLVVQHPQTGTADQSMQQMIDRMVQELSEQNPSDWDVVLPARVFSFCCKLNPSTRESPFTALCCSGTEPTHAPRGQQLEDVRLRDCEIVLRNATL
ncbi:uncharacterized protein LOC129456422 [Periophthalmus magnuspinnatus]|uniref:uncharacterized protein LOC129456422 n=1 Tax=Periophthalmus magnuspinnatus TaxID=409849 RepID=UPI002436318F|nr:uncharacterized protein LOC129456422 [Periophthalmus magnuspinnatus]